MREERFVELGSLTQRKIWYSNMESYNTIYELEVRESSSDEFSIITYFGEAELISQDRFILQCVRELHFISSKLSDDDWIDRMNMLLANMKIKEEVSK